MLAYVFRRLTWALPVLFFVSIGVFSMTRFLPGDPALSLIPVGEQTTDPAEFQITLQRVRNEYGLNDPLLVQYVRWLGKVLRGDLGTSIATRQDVAEMLARRLPVTASLGVFAALISLCVAVPAGIIAAVKHNSWADMSLTVFAVGVVAIPGFWLGMLLILTFVVWLGWLPGPGGYVKWWDNPAKSFQLTILPAFALGMSSTGSMMRLTRSSMLEVLGKDYIRTARAKGLAGRTVTVRHALRNAAIPLISAFGFQAISIFIGSVIIERLFAIPGSGSMAVDGIFARDFPVVQGFVLVSATVVVVINLVVDLAYGLVDPRIRLDSR